MDTSQDKRCRRCPRLGHEIDFAYCRTQGADSICPRVLDCWWESFDVQAFLRENLPAEEYEALAAQRPPKAKMLSLMELIEQARKNAAGNERK